MLSSHRDTSASLLLKLDADRCRAIDEIDINMLDSLMHVALSHVHQSGKVVGKREFLEGIAQRPRRVVRSDIQVSLWLDAAVMTGKQLNVFPDGASIPLFVTQLWIREAGLWQQVSFHCCKLAD